MKHLSTYVILLITAHVCVSKITTECKCDVEDYYWRDFHGDIPSDALPGGMDALGKPIYIGQVYAKFLIPAKIYSTDKQVYYEYGGLEHKATSNIKILCTRQPEQFEWIQTNNDDIKLLTHKNLVIGGFEPGCTTYIGRVRHDGEVMVGKALADNLPEYAGLHVTNNTKGKRYTSFDVLVFNKHVQLDVRHEKR